MIHRFTTTDNEWQQVVQQVTTSSKTSDNEWQRVTANENEWQRVVQQVTTNDNRWHRMTRSDNEWQFWPNFLFSNKMLLVWAVFYFITPEVTAGSKEAVAQTCSVKKVFLDMPQNWQENTCARVSFLIKLQAQPLVAASGSSNRYIQNLCKFIKE